MDSGTLGSEPISSTLAEDRSPAVSESPAVLPPSVRQAVEEVDHIVSLLREALDAMEEVLETVELAERQKTADEREIESLRRALRQLQRPRDAMRSGG